LIARVKGVLSAHRLADKPVWNTETGWYIANRQTAVLSEGTGIRSKVLDEREVPAYIARSYILGWAAGIARFYWYAWDNKEMGLTEADGRTVKQSARAYAEVYRWLVGARLDSCSRDNTGTWTCALVREGGPAGWILWNPDKTMSMPLPESWGTRRARDLHGGARGVGRAVDVGPLPILLERRED